MDGFRKLMTGVGMVIMVIVTLFVVPTAHADVTCNSGGTPLDSNGATKKIAAGSGLCFTVNVGRNQRNLLITFAPGSGKYNLYVGKNKQLRDATDKLGLGTITSRPRQWTITNPSSGIYYIAAQALDVGSTITIKANVLPPNAGATTDNGCTTSGGETACSSSQPQTLAALDIPNLKNAFIPATVPFTVPACGTITVSAAWRSDVPYRLVINGPLRPDLGSPYAITNGDKNTSTVRLQYEVATADADAGKQWEASLYLTTNSTASVSPQGSITVDVQPKVCVRVSSTVKEGPIAQLPAGTQPASNFTPSMLGSSQWGNGRLVVTARGSDGGFYLRWRDGKGWNDWQPQGMTTKFAPTTGSSAGKQIDLFAVGNDGALQTGRNLNGEWSGWSSLGGTFNSAPAVVSRRDGNMLDVFARADNRIWLIQQRNGAWGKWDFLGGETAPVAPAATALGDDRIDVFAVALNGALLHQKQEGGNWLNSWENLGGTVTLTSAPAAATRDSTLFVFGRGTDGALWYRTFNGTWSEWMSLGGNISSAPAAAVWSKTQLVVFARWSDGQLYQRVYDGSWSEWALFGPLP